MESKVDDKATRVAELKQLLRESAGHADEAMVDELEKLLEETGLVEDIGDVDPDAPPANNVKPSPFRDRRKRDE